MKDLSKLRLIVEQYLESRWEQNQVRDNRPFVEVEEKLVGLGCARTILNYESDELAVLISQFSLENSGCVIYYLGYDQGGHDFFAIPREIAERIVALGSLP
jgi:hypothetical protein